MNWILDSIGKLWPIERQAFLILKKIRHARIISHTESDSPEEFNVTANIIKELSRKRLVETDPTKWRKNFGTTAYHYLDIGPVCLTVAGHKVIGSKSYIFYAMPRYSVSAILIIIFIFSVLTIVS